MSKNDGYGIIYFIGPKDAGPVKIGYTSHRNPEKRRDELQTGSALKYEVIGRIEGGPLVERAIHGLLRPHRINGEWFQREAALALLGHMQDNGPTSSGERFWIAMADAQINAEESELELTPLQALAARVVSDIVHDRLRDAISIPIAQPIPLRAWLLSQQERDDATGDIAKDLVRDAGFPAIGTLEDYLRHITETTSNPSLTRAVFDAWIECSLAIKSLRFRTPSEGEK